MIKKNSCVSENGTSYKLKKKKKKKERKKKEKKTTLKTFSYISGKIELSTPQKTR